MSKKTKPDALQHRARGIVRGLARQYPDAHCALHHENPVQLLIATILSAQCTDVRVNMVTPALFARYPDSRAFAEGSGGARVFYETRRSAIAPFKDSRRRQPETEAELEARRPRKQTGKAKQ